MWSNSKKYGIDWNARGKIVIKTRVFILDIYKLITLRLSCLTPMLAKIDKNIYRNHFAGLNEYEYLSGLRVY